MKCIQEVLLMRRKNGSKTSRNDYLFLLGKVDPEYQPETLEKRTLFGLVMEQRRNDAVIDRGVFTSTPPVTKCKEARSLLNRFSTY